MKRPLERCRVRLGLEGPKRDDQTGAFKESRHPKSGVDPPRGCQRLRVPDVKEAFVHGRAAAQSEDEYGNDQSPKVQLVAVSEWMMFFGGWALAQPRANSKTPFPVSTSE